MITTYIFSTNPEDRNIVDMMSAMYTGFSALKNGNKITVLKNTPYHNGHEDQSNVGAAFEVMSIAMPFIVAKRKTGFNAGKTVTIDLRRSTIMTVSEEFYNAQRE